MFKTKPEKMIRHGICFALGGGSHNDDKSMIAFYPDDRSQIKKFYPEMWRSRPHRAIDSYWWSVYTKRGQTTRIKFLEKLIARMEAENELMSVDE